MHTVAAVEIAEGQVRIVCSCDWRTGWFTDEDGEIEPRREWAKHAGVDADDFGPHAPKPRKGRG